MLTQEPQRYDAAHRTASDKLRPRQHRAVEIDKVEASHTGLDGPQAIGRQEHVRDDNAGYLPAWLHGEHLTRAGSRWLIEHLSFKHFAIESNINCGGG